MNAIFVANKPAGMSSNHFLGRLKRKYGVKKAGFSGTLDPFASGCLIVAFGSYTKFFRFLDKSPKVYEATIWLGASSPSMDNENITKISNVKELNLEKLEAMTAICSVGLDMIAIPADTPSQSIAAMIADEAAIGVINQKTTAVRIIPLGKEGDMIEFGGLLGRAPVMKINKASSADFIARGGQIPAPIHSFKN